MEWDTSTVPDPQDPATFEASKLDWSEPGKPQQSELLELTTRLLEIRRTYPDFTDPRFDAGGAESDDEAGWLLLERGAMTMVVNFADRPVSVSVEQELFPIITLGEAEVTDGQVRLGPHSAVAAKTPQPLR